MLSDAQEKENNRSTGCPLPPSLGFLQYSWRFGPVKPPATGLLSTMAIRHRCAPGTVRHAGREGGQGQTTVYVGPHYEKNINTGVESKYYHFGPDRVAMRRGSVLYYLLADHLGSTSLTLDGSGNKVAELRNASRSEAEWTGRTARSATAVRRTARQRTIDSPGSNGSSPWASTLWGHCTIAHRQRDYSADLWAMPAGARHPRQRVCKGKWLRRARAIRRVVRCSGCLAPT